MDETHRTERRRFGLQDVSGTTIAIASLATLGAAALVTAPLWLWYRRRRKRADALARQSPRAEATSPEAANGRSAP